MALTRGELLNRRGAFRPFGSLVYVALKIPNPTSDRSGYRDKISQILWLV